MKTPTLLLLVVLILTTSTAFAKSRGSSRKKTSGRSHYLWSIGYHNGEETDQFDDVFGDSFDPTSDIDNWSDPWETVGQEDPLDAIDREFGTLFEEKGTRVGFYSRTCPRAESIVMEAVKSHFRLNPAIAPGLLRMHFHDCFVRGCDASILIDGSSTEKTTIPNNQMIGYHVIDEAKTRLEAACPGVVSCADILALAARDSVVLTKGMTWEVPTGRKDGRVSLASDVFLNLPGPRDSIKVQKQKFADKGLTDQDLVTLVGAHTIGTTACKFFKYRLYNFSTDPTANAFDPSINAAFLRKLKALCPVDGDAGRRIALDPGSPNKFDTSFFRSLKNGRGVLDSDQKLWADGSTRGFVRRFLRGRGRRGLNFKVEFGRAMVKLSNIEVKTGTDGEIRRMCNAVN